MVKQRGGKRGRICVLSSPFQSEADRLQRQKSVPVEKRGFHFHDDLCFVVRIERPNEFDRRSFDQECAAVHGDKVADLDARMLDVREHEVNHRIVVELLQAVSLRDFGIRASAKGRLWMRRGAIVAIGLLPP